MSRIKIPISAAIAIAMGLLVLAGYFIPINLLLVLRAVFVRWAVTLASIALIVGVANLFSVHWRKVSTQSKGGFYSVILLISMVLTILVAGYFGPLGSWSMWIFNYIQVPIESSLMAILAVVLAFASARLFRRRLNLFSFIFVITALVVLLGSVPLLGFEIPGLYGPDGLQALISRLPAAAGARGILLGVALGTIATALRVLIGADRPYGG